MIEKSKVTKKSNHNSESKIQQEIVLFFSQNYEKNGDGFIFAVPNGGKRNAREAKNLKNTGLRPGVADLVVIFKGGMTAFVEVKTDEGRQSEAQKMTQDLVEKLGFDYYLVRNLEQFKQYIEISHKKAEFMKCLDEYILRYHNMKNNALK